MTTAPQPHPPTDTDCRRPPRILVVEHEANAGAGLVGRRVTYAGMEMVTVGPETENTTIPTEASAYAGVIVLGGTPGPVEDDVAPWLPEVRALIRWCLDNEKPYFGVCLGGQMLAHVAGGSVGDVRQGPEVGLKTITAKASAAMDPVFAGLGHSTKAVQWHWLEVHAAPPNAVVLAFSLQSPVQAFRVGQTAWGTQFHLEAGSGTVRGWARGDHEDLHSLGLTPDGLIAEALEADAYLEDTWSPIIDKWVEIAAKSQRSHLFVSDTV